MIIKPRSLEEIARERSLQSPRPASTPGPNESKEPKRSSDDAGLDQSQSRYSDNDWASNESSKNQRETAPNAGYGSEVPPLPSESSNFQFIVLGVATLLGTILAIWIVYTVLTTVKVPPLQSLAKPINDALVPDKGPITVHVTLKNECSYAENAFMVKVMPDGPRAEFYGGKAVLEARQNQKIKLIANERYPFISYEDAAVKVAPEVTLVASCYDPEERAKALKESFDSRFSK
jgi:hypothetical protein